MCGTQKRGSSNIILLIIDALRADHLSCYGYQRPTSPQLDRIAEGGHLFLNAISPAPGTLSSMPSILTGRYVSEHGVGPLNRRLDERFVTMGQWLQQRGYLTAGFSNNAWVSEATGLNRGFSTFRQIGRLFPPGRAPSQAHVWAERLYRLFVSERYDMGDRRVLQEGIKWVRAASREDNPFFLFLHLLEVHSPYNPPNPYYGMFLPTGAKPRRRSFVRRVVKRFRSSSAEFHAPPETESEREEITALYDASIRYVDDLVGNFCTQLDNLGILDDTMLFITADHGENLGDHGLLGHGACLYESLVHVPLICVHRDSFPPSRQVETLVQAHDIFPTVVDLLGGDGGLGFGSVCRSLLPCNICDHPRTAVFSEDPRYGAEHLINTGLDPQAYDRALAAIRTQRWKYIQGTDGTQELYDLKNDPGEERDLFHVEGQHASELQADLHTWQNGLSTFDGQVEQIELDSVLVERLRSLGYVE